ncbi:MAG: hypothetical protein LC772_09220 [Chloroflexi bacterium]|nr:hypothetical protein [Chloroflexota bacterium]
MMKFRNLNRTGAGLLAVAAMALTGVVATAQTARADVLTFEDLSTSIGTRLTMPLPTNYHGFTWSSSAWVDSGHSKPFSGTGYDVGTDGNISLFTRGAQTISMQQGSTFTFNGAYITSAFQPTENVVVQGLRNGVIVDTQTITVNDKQATWFSFNFQNVDAVSFIPVVPPTGTINSNIVLDDITYNTPAVTISADRSSLWPPNHKWVPVTVTGTITDPFSGLTASYSVVDSEGQVQPSGTVNIVNGSYSFIVDLLASREGQDKAGRTYTITVTAVDALGNTSSASTVVVVPHDKGDGNDRDGGDDGDGGHGHGHGDGHDDGGHDRG